MCLLVSDKVVRQGDIGFFKTMRLPRMVLKNGGRFGRDGGRFDSQASSLGYRLTPFQGSMRACRMVAERQVRGHCQRRDGEKHVCSPSKFAAGLPETQISLSHNSLEMTGRRGVWSGIWKVSFR